MLLSCHASHPPRRHTAHRSTENAAGCAVLFFGLRGLLCACSGCSALLLSRFARLAAGSLSLRLGLVLGLFGPALVLAPLQAPLLDGSALLVHASSARDARLPFVSGLKQVRSTALCFRALAAVHPVCSRRLSASLVTLHTLRDGTLRTAPPKMPPAVPACFSVCAVCCAPAPGAQRFCLL